MECIRAKAQAHFALYGQRIGTSPATDLFYRNVDDDPERDTLMFETSNVNQFQNTEGFCTIFYNTHFHLFLWPGELPININYSICISPVKQFIKLT